MTNPHHISHDLGYDYDSRPNQYYQNSAWDMTIEQLEDLQAQTDPRRNIAPIQTNATGLRQTTMPELPIMDNWRYQQLQQMHLQQQDQHEQEQHSVPPVQQSQQQQQQHHHHHHTQLHIDYDQPLNGLEITYNPFHNITMSTQMNMVATTQPTLAATIALEQSYMMQNGLESMPSNWQTELQAELVGYTRQDMGLALSPYNQPTSSPTGSHVEVQSQPSTCPDDHSWTILERATFDYQFIDPQRTLNEKRSLSESSYSDIDPLHQTFMPNLDMGPAQVAYSPTTQSDSEYEFTHNHFSSNNSCNGSSLANTSNALARPIPIPVSSKASSPARSPGSAGTAGSPGRKPAKKSAIAAKVVDSRVTKKTSMDDKASASAKRVGKRKGPLNDAQRKQAGEIRKMRACLRCKFLKKTCDIGQPCAGCQPAHARLWQVPCTRIDIKDLGYFLSGKEFDFKRHISLGFSIANIVGFSDDEEILHVTHGYGHYLPIAARHVYVRNDQCLKMDWIEMNGEQIEYEVATSNMSAGQQGISTTLLGEYLDRHIDSPGTFVKYVDEYYGGTMFLSDMLKVAYRYYFRTKSRVIKKALKLMLAYTLTVHITLVEKKPSEEENVAGKVAEESSRFFGKFMAPVMINFQIKTAMADMWRDLHKEVLDELSSLYSSVYSGDKLKNWPNIFILASVLLAVWECMQFDCHFRVDDESVVEKFCNDMETTPVGVIVGLFSAISQKLPSILDWDTNKHQHLLAANPHAWETMTEIRDYATRYQTYLRDRPNAKFESKDFDSLSNKFVSRLVLRDIRAN